MPGKWDKVALSCVAGGSGSGAPGCPLNEVDQRRCPGLMLQSKEPGLVVFAQPIDELSGRAQAPIKAHHHEAQIGLCIFGCSSRSGLLSAPRGAPGYHTDAVEQIQEPHSLLRLQEHAVFGQQVEIIEKRAHFFVY